MKAPEKYAREAAESWLACEAEGVTPRGGLSSLITEAVRQALQDQEKEWLAGAQGGEVTLDELKTVENCVVLLSGRQPAAYEGVDASLVRLCNEVRRLWLILGDVNKEKALWGHAFRAGWKAACRKVADALPGNFMEPAARAAAATVHGMIEKAEPPEDS